MQICRICNQRRYPTLSVPFGRNSERAVTRSLSIIGEATKKVPADVKYQWQEISWRQMAGMRDRLVHDYMGVNYMIVWDVAKNIIPKFIPQIEHILSIDGNKF